MDISVNASSALVHLRPNNIINYPVYFGAKVHERHLLRYFRAQKRL
jgi:hypothetical protein